jgi:outer membrane receptor protein involved in Fe transport
MNRVSRIAIGLLASALAGAAAAQTTGTLQGTVTDAQEGALPGARVELVQAATNVGKAAQTTSAGGYLFDFLQPGTYALTVTLQGFKTATVRNVLVEAGRTATVNVRLEVGELRETVEVAAADQPVNTATPQVSTNVHEAYIRDLPNYNRNVLGFATLQPGVEVQTQFIAGGSQNLNILGTQARVNGNRGQRNNFYLDGMDSRNYRNEALQMPNPDAVQEVQISTSNTSAEYGRQVGGVFNVVTKSGTNSFHGDAFYFFRDKALNATPSGATEKPDQNQKTMGLTLGGPIRKEKTFFFASYDRYRDESAVVQDRPFAPTPAMVGGDFSSFLAGPNPRIIYDPATGQPFPGNRIPASAMDPVGRSIAGLLPTVGSFGDRFVLTATQPARNQTFYAKVDQHWTRSHTTTATWMRSDGGATYPTLDGNYLSIPAWGPQVNDSSQDLYHARHTWVARDNLLADFRAGYTKHHANRDNFAFDAAFPGEADPMTALGARNTTVPQEGARLYLPSVGIGNAGGGFGTGLYGHEGWLGLFDQPSFHFGGTVTWIKSKHAIKAGGDAIRTGQRYAVSGGAPAQTTLNFDGRFSSLGNGQNDFVYGMADLLLGRTTSFFQGGVLDYTIHNWDYFFFVQDEWRISPRLTLSGGLRYEFYLPPSVKGGQRTEYFTPNPVQGSVSTFRSRLFPNAPPGVAFAGDPGVPEGFYETEYDLIAPRLGLAWDVRGDGRTAVRAGFGKYYGSTALQTKDWPSEQNPWQPAASCLGFTIASNPWLECQANDFTSAPTPFTVQSIQSFSWPDPIPFIYGFDPGYKTAYNYQWNLSVEREVVGALTVQVGYIGNRGRNLTALQDINVAEFAPNATGGNVQARRPNQGYGNIVIATSRGRSSYDALQAAANVRLRDALLGRLTYTYQRGYADCDDDPVNIGGACYANPRDPAGERGENQFHQTLKLFFSWNLPFLRDGSGWAGRVLGGWQVSGNAAFYSGTPLNVTLNQDWNLDGVFGDRPDRAGSIGYVKEDLGDGRVRWIAPNGLAAPGCPAAGCAAGSVDRNRFGTLPRNAVFGPGNWTVDAALLKNFRLGDARYVQLRLEAYNVFNHPNLNNPDLTFNVDQRGVPSPGQNFGIIGGRTGNRLVQLGLKLHF